MTDWNKTLLESKLLKKLNDDFSITYQVHIHMNKPHTASLLVRFPNPLEKFCVLTKIRKNGHITVNVGNFLLT